MVLTVEPGRGSFVSRNNDSNCRTRERGHHLSLGTISRCRSRERGGGVGYSSLGTIIYSKYTTGRGGGGVICL